MEVWLARYVLDSGDWSARLSIDCRPGKPPSYMTVLADWEVRRGIFGNGRRGKRRPSMKAVARGPTKAVTERPNPESRTQRQCSRGIQQKCPCGPVATGPQACNSARLDVRGLLALRSAHNFELNLLAFFEALEAIHLNRAKVREQILSAVIRGDESVTLGVVEPFDSTSCHFQAIPRKTPHDPHHLMDAQIALTSELSVPQTATSLIKRSAV
jgi:hypothetical protein